MTFFSEHEPSVLESLTHEATHPDYTHAVLHALTYRRTLFNATLEQFVPFQDSLSDAAARLVNVLRSGHKVLLAGNGGSAAQAQHFAAELVGRFKRERAAFTAISLATDTAILTAVANDYSFQDVFARQVCALGQPGDMLIAFSTSGESENLIRAASVGRERCMTIVAVTASSRCRLSRLADVTVHVPVRDTAIAQELHMMVTHILCDIAENELAGDSGEQREQVEGAQKQ